MKMHKVYRDGKLYDEIDSETRDVIQIVRSYATDDQESKWGGGFSIRFSIGVSDGQVSHV